MTLSAEQAQVLLHASSLPSLKAEHPVTERVIAAIPGDKVDYRPDEIIRSAIDLAWHIVTWILVAIFLALALNPAVEFFMRHGLKRGYAAAVVFILAVAAIVGLGFLVLPPLVRQVTDFVQAVPDLVDDLVAGRGPLGFLQRDYHIVDRIREAIEQNGVGGVLGSRSGHALGLESRRARLRCSWLRNSGTRLRSSSSGRCRRSPSRRYVSSSTWRRAWLSQRATLARCAFLGMPPPPRCVTRRCSGPRCGVCAGTRCRSARATPRGSTTRVSLRATSL